MKKRIKVLQLLPKCNIRLSDLQEEIIAALPVEDFEVISAYLTGSPEDSDSGLHSQSEREKFFRFKKQQTKGLRLSLMWELGKFCHAEQFDIVITHRFKAFDIMSKLNIFLAIPHAINVVHNLDDFSRFYRKLNTFFFLNPRWTIVAVSQTVNNYLCSVGYGFNKKNTITINNAIDADKLLSRIYPREKARKQLALDNKSFVFGTIGRTVSVKGHIYLIKAFEQLYSHNKNIKLIIIGDGKLTTELQQYIDTHGLHNAVSLPGAIVDAKLLIAAFDCFVLSSLAEGFSLVILEAMAAKVPIVATRVGIVPSIISAQDESIAPKDIEKLSLVMQKYSIMPSAERSAIGESLQQCLLDNFDNKLYRKNYLKLIKEKTKSL